MKVSQLNSNHKSLICYICLFAPLFFTNIEREEELGWYLRGKKWTQG